ncbi:hypothetical protein NQD34_012033, partial [Periophthalmus magnuspinnatus]
VLKYLHRSNLTDLCLLNLAVSDLLFLLTLPGHYSAVSHWVFGDFMCHISGGLHNVGFYSSTFFMVAMTLDRYVLIQHVQKASKYRSMKTGMVMTTCVWALSFCISLPAFIFTQVVIERVACEYSPEDRTWIKYNIFSTNILGLVLPVTVMVVCYSRIIPTLMKIRSTQKRRIVKLIICIVVAFFLFWAPYNITLFLDFLRFEGTLTDSCELDTNLILSTTVTETLAFSHCCLNPIIYAFAGQKFMRRSLMMLRKLLPWAPSSRHRSDSSFRMSSVVSRTSFTTSNRKAYFLPILFTLFFVLGILGNSLVLWVIACGVRLRSMTDVCLLNLAVADLLLVCTLPFLAHQAWDQWRFGDIMCKLVLGVYHIVLYCGIFFICLMSIDRYLAIVHAVYAMRARTRSFGMIAAGVIWIAGFCASFPDVIFLQQQFVTNTTMMCFPFYPKQDQDEKHFWRVFSFFKMNVLGLFVPLLILGFCYSQILWRLMSSRTSKKQAIRLVLIVVAVFFCCWVPYNVVVFLKALELLDINVKCASSQAIALALPITEAMSYSHSCLNPILYVFVGEKFRR